MASSPAAVLAPPVHAIGKESVLFVSQPNSNNRKLVDMASSQFHIHVATSISEGKDWARRHRFDTLLVSSSFREDEVSSWLAALFLPIHYCHTDHADHRVRSRSDPLRTR